MIRIITIPIIVVLCCFAITGCGVNKEKIEKEYKTMTSATATPEHIREVAKFMDEKMPRVGEEVASEMLVSYVKYIHKYITENKEQAQVEVLRPYFESGKKALAEKTITDNDVKEYYQHLKAGSILIIFEEDSPTLKIDYSKLLKKYGSYISEPLNSLYELNSEEVARPMAENAVLKVSWETLLERAYWAENLIKKIS